MMSSVLQKQGLAEFFARISGRRREIFQVGEFQHDGRHAGVELEYRTRGSGAIISNLLAREWGGRVLVWAAPELERIYAIENHAPLGQGIQNLEACLRTT